jgi:hypothetical protein
MDAHQALAGGLVKRTACSSTAATRRKRERWARELAEAGEALAAAASRAHGLPVPKRLRRRRHVVKALKGLAAAKASKGETAE